MPVKHWSLFGLTFIFIGASCIDVTVWGQSGWCPNFKFNRNTEIHRLCPISVGGLGGEIENSGKKPDYGLFFSIISFLAAFGIPILKTNGVDLNWQWSIVAYLVIPAVWIWTFLHHASPPSRQIVPHFWFAMYFCARWINGHLCGQERNEQGRFCGVRGSSKHSGLINRI